jgi:hypothetical protein
MDALNQVQTPIIIAVTPKPSDHQMTLPEGSFGLGQHAQPYQIMG